MKLHRRIPVNLITGFLGTGKTTAVLHLLRHKPAHERWAVLVNEFGAVGIDGALLEGRGAQIRQIAGGCMCCVGNLPMKVALNDLIGRVRPGQVRPDRLLIEATGLGHPQAVIDTLTAEPYGPLLDMRAVICLVDPRKTGEQRYLDHPLFRDQLHCADAIVATKNDLCDARDRQRLVEYLATLDPPAAVRAWVANGELPPALLDGGHPAPGVAGKTLRGGSLPVPELVAPAAALQPGATVPSGATVLSGTTVQPEIPLQSGASFTRREQAGDGYYSCGWLFADTVRFDYQAAMDFLRGLNVLRLKGLLRTERGVYAINNDEGTLNIAATPYRGGATASAIEMIDDRELDWLRLEQQLLATRS